LFGLIAKQLTLFGLTMAKYRPVYTQIWEDEDEFLNYSDFEKVLFFYLITNPSCTESGIYKISPRIISFILRCDQEKFVKSLSKLSPNIMYDSDNKIVFVKNFFKYNGARHGRPDLILKSLMRDVTNFTTPLWHCFIKTYPKFEESFIKVLENLDNTFYKNEYEYDNDNSSNNVIDDPKPIEVSAKVLEFGEFIRSGPSRWQNYEKMSFDKWKILFYNCPETEPKELISAAKHYKSFIESGDDDKKYMILPYNFIEMGHWKTNWENELKDIKRPKPMKPGCTGPIQPSMDM